MALDDQSSRLSAKIRSDPNLQTKKISRRHERENEGTLNLFETIAV
jgi:hypothetical protein